MTDEHAALMAAQRKLLRVSLRQQRFNGLILFLLGVAVGLIVALLVMPSLAHARWTPTARSQIQAQADIIRQAAEVFDVDPALLAALGAHETHAQAVQGGAGDDCWGPGQVHYPTWAWLLRLHGIAEDPRDLLDPGLGWLAAAAVWAQLRADYPTRSRAQRACLYGVGSAALEFVEGCQYSRAVLANLPRARRALKVSQ